MRIGVAQLGQSSGDDPATHQRVVSNVVSSMPTGFPLEESPENQTSLCTGTLTLIKGLYI